jgi:hypothetical protein
MPLLGSRRFVGTIDLACIEKRKLACGIVVVTRRGGSMLETRALVYTLRKRGTCFT